MAEITVNDLHVAVRTHADWVVEYLSADKDFAAWYEARQKAAQISNLDRRIADGKTAEAAKAELAEIEKGGTK